MKILHTSDWHIGRSFHGTGMLDVQREAINQIVQLVSDREVDVVLIAGDIYDRALPPVDAVDLFEDALIALTSAGAQVVVTSGNHDSATRLGFGSRFMARSGVHLRTDIDQMLEPVIFGDSNRPEVAIWGIPYLQPRVVGEAWAIEEPQHTPVISEAVRRIGQARSRLEADGQLDADRTVHLVMAHLFAAGGHGSESERDIGQGQEAEGDYELTVGTLGQVPISAFDPFDYAALGHLHGPQTLSHTVRYSGSPVAYSFSEANHRKGVWLLEIDPEAIDPEGRVAPEFIELSAGRKLAVLKGEIEDLLQNPEYAWAEDAWCSITVTNQKRPERAYQRIKERFPDVLKFELPAALRIATTGGTSYAQKIASAKSDLDLTIDFVDHVRNRPANETEKQLLEAALEAARITASEATTR